MGRRPGSLNKKTLERLRAEGKLPEPIVPQGDRVGDAGASEPGIESHRLPIQEETESTARFHPENKPQTPIASVIHSFVEYTAPDGTRWRAEQGAMLCADFEIPEPGHLREWHGTFVTQEQMWLVLRRIYTVAPLLGETSPEDLQRWTVVDLAAKLGVDPSQVEGVLAESRLRWRRARVESGIDRGSAKRDARILSDEEVDKLVMRHGFNFITDPEERRFIATRCRDLEPFLEDESARTIARNAIQQEMNIFFIFDRSIQDYRDTKHEGSQEDIERRREANRKKTLDLIEARRQAVAAYEATMKVLGETPAQKKTIGQRLDFHDCLNQIVEGVQLYRSNGNNEIIDGMFTLMEVQFQMKETDLRKPSYRPDIAIAYWEACQNLWDKKYKPSEALNREFVRKIKRGWAKAMEELKSESGEEMESLEDDDMIPQKHADTAIISPGMEAKAGDAYAPGMPTIVGNEDIAVI